MGSGNSREGCIELLGRLHADELELDRQRGRGRLEVLDRLRMVRRIWIPDHCHPGQSWDRFLEQLHPLGAELDRHHREPRDVSARMREVRDQAGSNRISDERHDDGDGRRGALDRSGRGRTIHDDQIGFALDQVGGQRGDASVIPGGRSPFDHHVASLDVACVPQPLPKRLRLLALG